MLAETFVLAEFVLKLVVSVVVWLVTIVVGLAVYGGERHPPEPVVRITETPGPWVVATPSG